MRLRLLTGVWVMTISLVLGVLWNTQGIQAIQTSTPTPVDSDDLRVFPGDLVCDRQEPSPNDEGSSWMGITIGESTLDDVEALLATFRYEYRFIDDDDYDIRFVTWNPLQIEEGEPTSVRLCLEQNIVQVIAVQYAYPQTISRPNLTDFVAQLGEPDAITWSDNPAGRVVFWFERGFAAVVTVIPNELNDPRLEPTFGRVGEQLYFPYQEVDGYEDRWPYNQTRKFNAYLPSPEDPSVDFGPENPFNFEEMIATITVEPSRTPTSTFTVPTTTDTATP